MYQPAMRAQHEGARSYRTALLSVQSVSSVD